MAQDNKPAERGVYAFHKIKLGEFLLFLDEDELYYNKSHKRRNISICRSFTY